MAQLGQFRNKQYFILSFFSCVFLFACTTKTDTEEHNTTTAAVPEKKIPTPDFNADSAYQFVKAQVDFGPRVPASKAHAKCAEYLINKLKSYGLEVILQQATIQTFDKKQFTLKNIIASHNQIGRASCRERV